MTVQTFPTGLKADSEEWVIQYNTQSFESDLNGAIQTAELPGARWSVSMTFGSREGKAARRLQGFLAGLKGRAGRFYVTPADWQPLGSPSGTGLVATNTAAGASSIPTDGWTASVTELFCAGDYFEVNGELKKLTADVNSDGTGLATLNFAPPLRKSVTDGMQIRYTEPRAVMMLSADKTSWQVRTPVVYGLTLDGTEALDI